MKVSIKIVAGTIGIEELPKGGLDYKLPKGLEYVILVEGGGAYGISQADRDRSLKIDEDGNVNVEDIGVILDA